MRPPYQDVIQLTGRVKTLFHVLLLQFLLPCSGSGAAPGETEIVEVKLGDYRFVPAEIQLAADRPTVLRLTNTDTIVPHNFTLSTSGHTPDIDVDILGGESVDVRLEPLPAGSYTFYCNKKMVFMKSHRKKGMEGRLIVTGD